MTKPQNYKNYRLKQNESCREKIQTTQIIKRLNNHVLTEKGDADYDKKTMTSTQITAANILLKKTLPDLTSTDLNVDGHISVSDILAGMDEPDGQEVDGTEE